MDALFPPGPQKSLILGDAPHFKVNPLDFMQQAARAYGDLVHFRFGPSHAYLIVSPRDAHDVLVERHHLFYEQPGLLRALYSMMGHDLRAPKEAASRRPLRRGAFALRWLDGQIDGAARIGQAALDGWQDGDSLEPLAVTLVAATLFGDANSPAARDIGIALNLLSDDGGFRSPLTLPGWVPTPGNRTQARAARSLRHAVDQAMRMHGDRKGIVSILLAGASNREQVAEELLALFRAGRFAVMNTVAQARALLAAHPEAAEPFQAEIAAVLGGGLPTAEDLPNLAYCEMVLKETLRLHPAVNFISRQAKRETRLGDYYAPAGSTIFVSPYIIHHSQRHYASPEQFLPERFGASFARRGSASAYLPFGAGTYAEGARDYALALGTLALALVAQHSQRIQLSPDSPVIAEACQPNAAT